MARGRADLDAAVAMSVDHLFEEDIRDPASATHGILRCVLLRFLAVRTSGLGSVTFHCLILHFVQVLDTAG